MSHVAVILTSERCGHCRNMRGNGRLLSQAEIKKDNRQPNIPGGNYYDYKYMKKLMTVEMGSEAKLRIVNLHWKSFNPTEGMMDISIFTLENDGTVRQTMLREINGKTNVSIYSVGEIGKVISTQDMDKTWAEINKMYVPVNISNYAFFFPSLVLFEGNEWMNGIQKGTPIYGYVNGFDTKTESPYGGNAAGQPNVKDFVKFLQEFFNGTRKLLGKPEKVDKPVMSGNGNIEEEKVLAPLVKKDTDVVTLPAAGSVKKFRLYVVEN
jgi:hypothetical protein